MEETSKDAEVKSALNDEKENGGDTQLLYGVSPIRMVMISIATVTISGEEVGTMRMVILSVVSNWENKEVRI